MELITDKYKIENTFLVLDTVCNDVMRWTSDKKLFYAGSVEDALIDLDAERFKAYPVALFTEKIQQEYVGLIDEAINNDEN